ncbi:sigma-E processing peptidase SpoIIGA [Clostridium polyendosporum]|uniref:Sporulation sigma-E factor-processing peptidase n=1 Tax=Clostridium polyendosporum TaxID=69208 RepID=A0A919VF94_9CLOT|nr:sigma-E processing peptidase SpoIIGA [Clostridium polyendosporum]GIM27902.1 sigma-E processing peptidase SpoIIGA [Clostridium polyendosporum]
MEVYIDVVVFENFIINSFLLLVTIQIVRGKCNYKRIILSALLGALYTIVLFIPKLYLLTILPIKLLVAMVMVYVASSINDLIFLIKSSVIFILVSMLLCGFCFGFSMYQNNYNISESFIITSYSFKYMLLSIMIIYLLLYRIMIFIKDRKVIFDFTYEIEFTLSGECYKVKAFLDTGNELIEPATCLPVIIVEEKIIKIHELNKKSIYYVPYKAINGHSGNLKGYKVDKVNLFKDNKKLVSKDVIICLCNEKLSSSNDYGALLSRAVL